MTEPTPAEVNEADRQEQETPVEGTGTTADAEPPVEDQTNVEADDGDLAESAIEVPMHDDDERR